MSEPLSCSFHLKINRPVAETFAAVYESNHLVNFFATGGASANLDPGTVVQWAFKDFPEVGSFPVRVQEMVPNERIHLQWESGIEGGWNDVLITFEPLENPGQTLVRVTETGWPMTEKGIKNCTENAGGWANMATCLKFYVEHGTRLREFMF